MSGPPAQRRALVIGSQCAARPRLGFLPELAGELCEVLTDPTLGGCAPALPDRPSGGLVQDLTREEVLDALDEAFRAADRAGATLLIALLGHGVARGDDFYYLTVDAPGRGNYRRDVHLSHHLKEALSDAADLDGLIVLLDTCHAGVAAQQAATGWGEVGLGRDVRRYELLSASADGPAYNGDFTRTLIEVLRRGVPAAGSTVDARDLRAPLLQGAAAQRPQRVTVDGGGWAQDGDQGLWLAHNAALRDPDDDATGLAALDRVTELVTFLQPTPTLDALVAAVRTHRCVVVTGPRGSGKSTLAAALTRPAAGRGHVPDALVHAIAFAAGGSTLAILTAALAGQLAGTVPGYTAAARAYEAALDPAEQQGLPALARRVIGPLGRLSPPGPVRLVIDALDELPEMTQQAVRAAVITALEPSPHGVHRQQPPGAEAGVGFVLTARPAAARPPGAYQVPVDQPGDDVITAYFAQRGVRTEFHRRLVRQAGGSWLHAHLLAEQAVRPGFTPEQLPAGTRPALTALYEAELLAAGAGDRDRWETRLRPVLAVLAVAGTGSVLPLPLAVAASARLGGPRTPAALRDVVARLSGLIVRSQPGQPSEQLGLFHLSLAEEYLLRRDPDVQFPVDPIDGHAALAAALRELAPVEEHDLGNPLHRYALRAEPDHRWAGRDSTGVLASLHGRPLDRARDEQERWHRWEAAFRGALGPEHPDTLTARGDLAYRTRQADVR